MYTTQAILLPVAWGWLGFLGGFLVCLVLGFFFPFPFLFSFFWVLYIQSIFCGNIYRLGGNADGKLENVHS